MIKLLRTIVVAEAALILGLFLNTPIRNPLLSALDSINRWRGIVIVRKLAGISIVALFTSNTYTLLKISHHLYHPDSLNLTDQISVTVNLLQAFLTGICLFLPVVINKLRQLIREKDSLETFIKAEEQKIGEKKNHLAYQLLTSRHVAAELRLKLKKLESEHQTKTNKAEAAAVVLLALKEKSEESCHEYDRLVDYNKTLRQQLQSIDECLVKDNQTTIWTNLKSNIMPWGIKTTNKNRATEVGSERSENEVLLSNKCHQLFFNDDSPISWPRHRRPIHQH